MAGRKKSTASPSAVRAPRGRGRGRGRRGRGRASSFEWVEEEIVDATPLQMVPPDADEEHVENPIPEGTTSAPDPAQGETQEATIATETQAQEVIEKVLEETRSEVQGEKSQSSKEDVLVSKAGSEPVVEAKSIPPSVVVEEVVKESEEVVTPAAVTNATEDTAAVATEATTEEVPLATEGTSSQVPSNVDIQGDVIVEKFGVDESEDVPLKDLAKGSRKRKQTSEDKKGKKVMKAAEKEVPIGRTYKNVWFASVTLSRNWDTKESWMIIPEKKLVESSWNVPEILDLIKEVGLLPTLTKPKPSVHQLVHEFAANITDAFGDPMHDDYGVVFVRQKKFEFSPELINEYLGTPNEVAAIEFPEMDELAKVLTAGSVTGWAGTTISSRYLTVKYAILHSIGVTNWIPTKSKQVVTKTMAKLLYAIGNGLLVNFGLLVFDALGGLAAPIVPKRYFGYPSIVYELLIAQAPDIVKPSERVSVDLMPMFADHKLFKGDHVMDIARGSSLKGKVKKGEASTSAAFPKALVPHTVRYLEERLEALKRDEQEIRSEKKVLTKILREVHYPKGSDESESDGDGESSDSD